MIGFMSQFALGAVPRITRKTVSASGTVSALITGSTARAWKLLTGNANSGAIRISTVNGTTQFASFGAGRDSDWLPGSVQGYWFFGTVAGDEVAVLELY